MSPERRPGDPGWKPSEQDIRAAEEHDPGLVLRIASVLPFVLIGAFGVIAFVAWLVVFVFGVRPLGQEGQPVWEWAAGKPVGEVVGQVALLLVIGAVCAGVVVASIYATGYGVRAYRPRRFWFVAQTFFSVLGFLLLAGRTIAPDFMKEIGLSGREWFFAFGLVAFSMIVVGLRMRREGDDEAGEEDSADD
jgi:hypothetical protein